MRAHREKIDSRLLSYLLISPRKRAVEKGLKEGVLIHIGEKKKRVAKVTKLYSDWFMTENEMGVKEGFQYTDVIHLGSIKMLLRKKGEEINVFARKSNSSIKKNFGTTRI